jgi:hypothetical protein
LRLFGPFPHGGRTHESESFVVASKSESLYEIDLGMALPHNLTIVQASLGSFLSNFSITNSE